MRYRNESITVRYQNYFDEIFVEFRQSQRKPHQNENFTQHSTAKFDLQTNLIDNLIFAKRFEIRTVLYSDVRPPCGDAGNSSTWNIIIRFQFEAAPHAILYE